jgi:exonuclease VII small subunit
MIDITGVAAQARKEVAEEQAKKAVGALKRKLTDLANAQQVVKNLEREIADLEASIADGSFHV